jgi:hypothetical protein
LYQSGYSEPAILFQLLQVVGKSLRTGLLPVHFTVFGSTAMLERTRGKWAKECVREDQCTLAVRAAAQGRR